MKMKCFGIWLLALLACPWAQAADLVFAVTEGVTYQSTSKEVQTRFQPLANQLAKALQRPVQLVIVPSYKDLRAGLSHQQYDLAFIHPAHIALSAIKSGRYKALAWTDGFTDYAVSLLVKPSPSLGKLSDLNGKTVVTTDPESITATMLQAVLRENRLNNGEIRVSHTQYQDALPFYLDNGFAQAGATAAKGVVKAWTDKGGKVLLTSQALPIKQILASTKLMPEEQDKIRAVLFSHDGTGRTILDALGYKGFVVPDSQVEQKATAWLGL